VLQDFNIFDTNISAIDRLVFHFTQSLLLHYLKNTTNEIKPVHWNEQ